MIRGHKWSNKIDFVLHGIGEPQFFQCYCKRCRDFKFGILNKNWINEQINKKTTEEWI